LSKISNSNTNLGFASRILKNGCSNSASENLKPSLKQDFDVRAVDLNVTFSEDNLSANESVFEPVFTTINSHTKNAEREEIASSDMNNSMAMTCVTTITLDSFDVAEANSFDSTACKANANINGPRLNLVSKKVRKDDFDDMKEVTMLTVPGEFTTIMLEFGNKKNTRQTILSKATCMRFDPTVNSDANDDNFNTSDVFQVSPRMLEIPLNSQKALYLTFAPNSRKEGIYTGVLKIKNCKKSFILLLRGEAMYPPEKIYSEPTRKIDSKIENNIQDTKPFHDYDFEISDDDNDNKQSGDDEPLLGLELGLGLARPPDFTKFNDLLAPNNENKYNDCANKNSNSDTFDWSNTLTKRGMLEGSKENKSDCLKNNTNNFHHHKYSNTYASSLGDVKTDSIAEKVASDLLKVRQKVIKDWLDKENSKREENYPTNTPPSASSSYSNIFSVLSKNSSTYQPTPNRAYNSISTNSTVIARKCDYSANSKANTTASSKQTLYSSQGLKSNDLVKTIINDSTITNPSIGLFFRR
jgi:hypothetical protein